MTRTSRTQNQFMNEKEIDMPTSTLNSVVIYHSGYGHTQRAAETVHEGAKSVASVRPTIMPR